MSIPKAILHLRLSYFFYFLLVRAACVRCTELSIHYILIISTSNVFSAVVGHFGQKMGIQVGVALKTWISDGIALSQTQGVRSRISMN